MQIVIFGFILSFVAVYESNGNTNPVKPSSDPLKEVSVVAISAFGNNVPSYDIDYTLEIKIPDEGIEFYKDKLDKLENHFDQIKLTAPGAGNKTKEEIKKILVDQAREEASLVHRELYKCNIRQRVNQFSASEDAVLFPGEKVNGQDVSWPSFLEYYSTEKFLFVINRPAKQVRMLAAKDAPPFQSAPWKDLFFKVDHGALSEYIDSCPDVEYSINENQIVVSGKYAIQSVPFDFKYQEGFRLIIDKESMRPLSFEKMSNAGGMEHVMIKKTFKYDDSLSSVVPSETVESFFQPTDGKAVEVRHIVAKLVKFSIPVETDKAHNSPPDVPEGFVFSNDLTNDIFVTGEHFMLLDKVLSKKP